MNQTNVTSSKIEWPDEFPGAIWYGQEELEAATKVIQRRSPFRYYGPIVSETRTFEQVWAMVGLRTGSTPRGSNGSM